MILATIIIIFPITRITPTVVRVIIVITTIIMPILPVIISILVIIPIIITINVIITISMSVTIIPSSSSSRVRTQLRSPRPPCPTVASTPPQHLAPEP